MDEFDARHEKFDELRETLSTLVAAVDALTPKFGNLVLYAQGLRSNDDRLVLQAGMASDLGPIEDANNALALLNDSLDLARPLLPSKPAEVIERTEAEQEQVREERRGSREDRKAARMAEARAMDEAERRGS